MNVHRKGQNLITNILDKPQADFGALSKTLTYLAVKQFAFSPKKRDKKKKRRPTAKHSSHNVNVITTPSTVGHTRRRDPLRARLEELMKIGKFLRIIVFFVNSPCQSKNVHGHTATEFNVVLL